MSKLHLITYGCQMNEYDSERVAGLLEHERYELTARPEEADLILVNTCSIREKAEDKVFSQLGALKHLKRRRTDLIIGVMGCMAQLQKGRIQERAPYVDLVFGSPAIARVAELVARARQGRGPVLETGEGALVKITARPDRGQRLRAFVTVMEGCEKHCTFCVVPTTRGRERSHAPEVIVEEAAPQQTVIKIEPTQPEVIYVPAYNPTVVYGTWGYPTYPPVYWPPSPVWYPGGYLAAGFAWGVGLAAAGAIFGGWRPRPSTC